LKSAGSREKFIQILKQVIAKFSEVQLAYLFGSYAKGRAIPISNFAVLTVNASSHILHVHLK